MDKTIKAKDIEAVMLKQAKKAGLKIQWVSLKKGEYKKSSNSIQNIGVVVRYKELPVTNKNTRKRDEDEDEKMFVQSQLTDKAAAQLTKALNDFEVSGVEFNDNEFEIYGTDEFEYYTSLRFYPDVILKENLTVLTSFEDYFKDVEQPIEKKKAPELKEPKSVSLSDDHDDEDDYPFDYTGDENMADEIPNDDDDESPAEID